MKRILLHEFPIYKYLFHTQMFKIEIIFFKLPKIADVIVFH